MNNTTSCKELPTKVPIANANSGTVPFKVNMAKRIEMGTSMSLIVGIENTSFKCSSFEIREEIPQISMQGET